MFPPFSNEGTIMTWVLHIALLVGSGAAYILEPLTTIQDHIQCSSHDENTATMFELCTENVTKYVSEL
jgi:hypothetical protein